MQMNSLQLKIDSNIFKEVHLDYSLMTSFIIGIVVKIINYLKISLIKSFSLLLTIYILTVDQEIQLEEIHGATLIRIGKPCYLMIQSLQF